MTEYRKLMLLPASLNPEPKAPIAEEQSKADEVRQIPTAVLAGS